MRRLRRILRARSGAAALEFALVMPVLAFAMLATADYGNALQQIIRLEAAARAGGQVAMTRPGDTAAIRAQVMNHLQGLALSSATGCGGAAGATGDVCVTVQYWCQCNPATAAAITPTSSVTCDTGENVTPPCPSSPLASFVSINVTRPYGFLLIAPNRTLRGNVELRVL